MRINAFYYIIKILRFIFILLFIFIFINTSSIYFLFTQNIFSWQVVWEGYKGTKKETDMNKRRKYSANLELKGKDRGRTKR